MTMPFCQHGTEHHLSGVAQPYQEAAGEADHEPCAEASQGNSACDQCGACQLAGAPVLPATAFQALASEVPRFARLSLPMPASFTPERAHPPPLVA